jgi:hypothetical protein
MTSGYYKIVAELGAIRNKEWNFADSRSIKFNK